MSLSSDDVAKIAHLARLAVEPEESAALGRDLSNILDLVAQMDAVDTGERRADGASARNGPAPARRPWTEENMRDRYQANAPAVENGLFLVPKVIE